MPNVSDSRWATTAHEPTTESLPHAPSGATVTVTGTDHEFGDWETTVPVRAMPAETSVPAVFTTDGEQASDLDAAADDSRPDSATSSCDITPADHVAAALRTAADAIETRDSAGVWTALWAARHFCERVPASRLTTQWRYSGVLRVPVGDEALVHGTATAPTEATLRQAVHAAFADPAEGRFVFPLQCQPRATVADEAVAAQDR